MKNLISIIVIILVVLVWLFPVCLAAYKDNYWLIFLYIVWWIPAYIISGLLLIVDEHFGSKY